MGDETLKHPGQALDLGDDYEDDDEDDEETLNANIAAAPITTQLNGESSTLPVGPVPDFDQQRERLQS